jgi:hypothetical protein
MARPPVRQAEGARLSEPSDRMSIAAVVPWWMDDATLARCNTHATCIQNESNINNLRDDAQFISSSSIYPLRQRHKGGKGAGLDG